MKNDSRKTARTRKTLSVPMRWLKDNTPMAGRRLDFGCGKGFDAEQLGMEKYDLNFEPKMPAGLFDTITCNYVLNVIESPEERMSVEDQIIRHLNPGGVAYISVRDDLKDPTPRQSSGTWQGMVTPTPRWDLLKHTKGRFRIYGFHKAELVAPTYSLVEGGEDAMHLIQIVASDFIDESDGPNGPRAMMGHNPFHNTPWGVHLYVDYNSTSYVLIEDLGISVQFGPEGTQAIRAQFPEGDPSHFSSAQVRALACPDEVHNLRKNIASRVRRLAMRAIMLAVKDGVPVVFYTFLQQIARKAKSDEAKRWQKKLGQFALKTHDDAMV
jgi:hypothetical protein